MSVEASRPRVLAIAEAANPEWVSVPLVGWSMAQALREVADVHLVTQVRNREAIQRAGIVEGDEFTAIDTEALARPAYRAAEMLRMGEGKGWTMIQAAQALTYPWFERKVWERFGADLKAGRYDLVHRITPLSPTATSPLAAKLAAIDVPFVVGPINGGVPWPEGYGHVRRAEREWLGYIRDVHKLVPGRSATLKHASVILTGSRLTAAELPKSVANKTVWLPENAIDTTRFSGRASPGKRGAPFRTVFVGRLVALKGVDMLIEAARPLIERGELVIDIVGDGPEMPRLKTLADPLGAGITFHGWQAHGAVQDVLLGGDVLAFPSIREFGGGVVLEAMALGLPPLVVDYAGPGELVDETTGYKVPCLPPEGLVPALRETLERIVAEPDVLAAKGARAAAKVARHFTWPAKARQIDDVYRWVLAGREGPAPNLFAEAPSSYEAGS